MTPMEDWWLICNNDVEFLPGQLEQINCQATIDKVNVVKTHPGWCCFTIGSDVVEEIGLFDEAFYPAYFEDIDYIFRLNEVDKKINVINVSPIHQNSSTTQSDLMLQEKMHPIFEKNEALFNEKKVLKIKEKGWSLAGRRDKDFP
jgi:GT2 family glycosyltransferase